MPPQRLPWLPPGVPFFPQRYATSPAPATALGRLGLEAELNGRGNGWTDLTADLLLDPTLSIEYGIPDTGATALTAVSGEMRFALANGAWNSAGLEGRYSPGHPNCRPGFRIGIRVRFTMTLDGVQYRKHVGWLAEIDPIAGRYRERRTLCTSLDWMDQAARSNPTVATQANRTSDLVLSAVVAATPQLPESTAFDTGDSTFAFALDNSQNESGSVLNELARIAQSEPGFIYCKGDGTLVFERRTRRYATTVFATFNETTQGLAVSQALNQVRNKVKITTHPRRVDGGTSVLATNQGAPTIAAGETRRFTLYYTDPNNRSQRCGGTNIIPPVSGTDYTAGFVVSIVGVAGANSVDLDVTNSTGSAAALSLLQIRGSYLLDYDPIDSVVQDLPSIQTYGETRLIQDMPYQSDASVAGVVGANILNVWGNPQVNEVTLSYVPPDDTALAVALAVEPGTPLGVVESITGVNGNFYVQQVSMRAKTDKIFEFEWLCQRAASLPFVASRTTSAVTTDQTSHSVNMPSGIQSGDLLISVFTSDDIPTITWPAGWTEFALKQSLLGQGNCSIAYRKADGTEGASITVTTSTAQESTSCTLRILGAADPSIQPPEATSAAGVPDFSADPPLLTPTGGVKSFLWLAVGCFNDRIPAFKPTLKAIPPNYGNTSYQGATTQGYLTCVVERTLRAASEEPGLFTWDFGRGWMAFTVAIHPATV